MTEVQPQLRALQKREPYIQYELGDICVSRSSDRCGIAAPPQQWVVFSHKGVAENFLLAVVKSL